MDWIAGAIAGLVADAVTHPLSTVKTRLQVQGAGSSSFLYSGPLQAMSQIIKTEGIRPLYRGIGAVAITAAPGQALYFGGYEFTRSLGWVLILQ